MITFNSIEKSRSGLSRVAHKHVADLRASLSICSSRPLAKKFFFCCLPLALIVMMLSGGCAKWYPNVSLKQNDVKKEAAFELPAGHIGIQTLFLRLEPNDHDALDSLWPMLDEVSFDFDLRQRLELNGMRCGAITGTIPPAIQSWIERSHLESKMIHWRALARTRTCNR